MQNERSEGLVTFLFNESPENGGKENDGERKEREERDDGMKLNRNMGGQ